MNESVLDRGIRVAIGVAMLIIGFGVVGGTAGTVIGIASVIPLLTGTVGFCPIYRVLGIRTNNSSDEKLAS